MSGHVPASIDGSGGLRPASHAALRPGPRQASLRTLRLASQVLFFAAFLLLLLLTEFRGSLQAAQGTFRLPYPAGIFLESDPLVAGMSALATHTLYRGLLWSLVILVPTFFLGRFFCGWICPLGSLNHLCGSLKSEKKRGAKLVESNRHKTWQATKYYVLAVALVLALFGSLAAAVLDPISLTVRSLTVAVLPALDYGVDASLDALSRSGVRPLRQASEAGRMGLRATAMAARPPFFGQAVLVGALFIVILVLNTRVTRFWCRALCPLGALLGIASRWSILALRKQDADCDDCRRCLLRCQGGDDPVPGARWHKAECHLCFNCVGECPRGALAFGVGATPPGAADAPQLQRRKLLASAAIGAGLLPLMRTGVSSASRPDPRLIRPPGALGEVDFLARCIRCGECMKVCPNNALQPALTEAGVEGLWTPVLVPRVGYCEPGCVLCGQLCPTGAIWEITQAEKAGRPANDPSGLPPAEPMKIGTAFYDQGRCLPWAMATECIVCEEWCPTSPKAIYLRPADVVGADGNVRAVRQPHVDANRCTGCGACEYACPVRDRPAVYVTSIGESRSRTNRILLDRAR